jgi:hypothetical protein
MAENPHLYALLVGIDNYRPPVGALSGCVNDLKRMQAYLESQSENFKVNVHTLVNEEAEKQAIVDGFQNHLSQASEGDVALFYYSGHGTQEEADPELWRFETDAKLETLVCYDGIVQENGEEQFNLLADKELRFLIHELSLKNPHLVTIFDCCHSGGNTRNHFVAEEKEEVKERRHIPQARLSRACPPRTWDKFIFAGRVDPEKLKTLPLGEAIPEGHHIQLAACSSDQSAFEANGSGVFTGNLIEVLQRSDGAVTYYDLRSRIRHFIKNQYNQTPQIYAQGRHTDPLFAGFLNRKITGKPLYGNVVWNPKRGLVMDMGSMHGISLQAETVKVQSQDGKLEFTARIDAVGADDTVLFVEDQKILDKLDQKGIYRGYVEDFLSSPIKVHVDPEDEHLSEAIPAAGHNVNISEGAHDADYAVYIQDNKYVITPPSDPERPLVKQVGPVGKQAADTISMYLRHISQYEFVKNLHNPNSFLFEGHPIEIEVIKVDRQGRTSPLDLGNDEIFLPFERMPNGEWGGKFRMKLTNRHSGRLYVSLMFLTLEFQVYPKMLEELTVGLDPGESVWAYEGDDIELDLPEQIVKFNWPESVTYFKLIANTQDFDVTLLEQGPLPAPTEATRAAGRNIKLRKKGNPQAKDWTTRLITLRVPNPHYEQKN